jgi:hypothetical protein
MNFVRYTVIFGGYDVLQPTPYPGTCITDHGGSLPSGWECLWFARLESLGWDDKTASRYPKMKPYAFFDNDQFLYHDGSVQLHVPPKQFIDFLGRAHIAAFLHPQRDCIYDEGDVCAGCGAAEPEAVAKQMDDYREDGYPAHNGLHASTLLVWRNSARGGILGNLWWEQFLKYETRRDQLSLDYCLWKLGMKCATIPGNLWNNELMDVGHHAERG